MNISHQDQLPVVRFCDLITEAGKPVKHAAHRVSSQDQTEFWEWQLAGTYIIVNCEKAVAMTCDGWRLARFTASPRLDTTRFKLTAGQLEELFVPIV